MERDFMGLGSKEPLVMVKEENINDGFKDTGFSKASVIHWPFSNKISALPHFLSNSAKSFNHDGQQSGTHFPLPGYPFPHDMYSIRPHDARLFSVSNQQAIPVSMGKRLLKQQLLGGTPVTSPHVALPTPCSVAGFTDQWNNNKNGGSSGQLTIFYGGTVNVYDNITAEKAQAIMILAGSGSSTASNVANLKSQVLAPNTKSQLMNTPNSALSSPISVSSNNSAQSGSGSTSTDELVLAKTTGAAPVTINPVGSVATTAAMMPSVPQARKASLARFLEKRKERMMNASPYNLCKSSSECTAAESNGANFAASPAVDSTLY